MKRQPPLFGPNFLGGVHYILVLKWKSDDLISLCVVSGWSYGAHDEDCLITAHDYIWTED